MDKFQEGQKEDQATMAGQKNREKFKRFTVKCLKATIGLNVQSALGTLAQYPPKRMNDANETVRNYKTL